MLLGAYYTLTLPEILYMPIGSLSSAKWTFCIHSKGSGHQEKSGSLHSCGSLIKDQRGNRLHSYSTKLRFFFFNLGDLWDTGLILQVRKPRPGEGTASPAKISHQLFHLPLITETSASILSTLVTNRHSVMTTGVAERVLSTLEQKKVII